jgi:hypothetical protein
MDGSLISASKEILIINDSTTTLGENIQNPVLTIHPNPTSDLFYISAKSFIDGKVRIYDLVGKICFEDYFSSEQNKIDLTALQAGNYIVEIEILGEISRTKLIKK